MIEDDSDLVSEGKHRRESERRTIGGEHTRDGDGGQIEMPDVMRLASSDDAF